MDSVSPVYTEETVQIERVIALDQPQYSPIVILPVVYEDGTQTMAVRFRFTEDERKLIVDGGDLLLTELTCGLILDSMTMFHKHYAKEHK